jgi:hypothetical protein
MKRNKKVLISTIIAFVVATAFGVFLHFTFELSGKNYFVALFSPVNESIWEHLKLLFFPFLFTAAVEYFIYGIRTHNFFSAKLVGIVSALFYVVSMYYTVVGAFGTNSQFMNISIFVIGTAIAYLIPYRLLHKNGFGGGFYETLAVICFAAITLAFFVFTFKVPMLPIFRDPTNMKLGIT